jgi:hypothetical protein
MAKDTYPRIQARTSPEMKRIFDEFLKAKGNMGQAEFFEQYLPTLLISIDRDLYLYLYKKVYGNKELDQMIKVLERGDS